MDSGRIAVIEHSDIRGKALDESDLRFSQRCTATSNDVLNTGLEHRNHVHLTLYQITAIRTTDGLFGLEETV